jgi:hypothetical protein
MNGDFFSLNIRSNNLNKKGANKFTPFNSINVEIKNLVAPKAYLLMP